MNRNLGKNGLKLPNVGFSAWNAFGTRINEQTAEELVTLAYENGVNYFDTGDGYANGKCELVLGNILKKKNWKRSSYIVSTKLFWYNGPTAHNGGGLSRKFIIEAVEASLKRLQLKYIDILIINKLDGMCPMEELARIQTLILI
jgi:aryl-alcohol dehydrogenase-like predicted oxidoreductase